MFDKKKDLEISSVSSNTSVNFENYNQLLDAFKETHEEANRLALLNNRLKGLNNWLENRVKTLEEELSHSKIDFENLEMVYQNFSYECVDLSFPENCESLQKKVHYLLKIVDKFSKGQLNLETVLVSQNCVFGKVGLGFNPNSKYGPIMKLQKVGRNFTNIGRGYSLDLHIFFEKFSQYNFLLKFHVRISIEFGTKHDKFQVKWMSIHLGKKSYSFTQTNLSFSPDNDE